MTRKTFLGVLAFSALALPALAGKQDFTLINKTGFAIDQVYVSESSKSDWEDDVLGSEQLPNGQSKKITFNGYGTKVCKFDIKIVDPKGTGWTVEEVNLCETNQVTFKTKNGKVIYVTE